MAEEPESFEQLVSRGRRLLRQHDPTRADSKFHHWDAAVARWLDENLPGTGVSAEWGSLGNSPLVVGSCYDDSSTAWSTFREVVQTRLKWLARVPRIQNYQREQADLDNNTAQMPSDKVFVVHGRDETARETVARFLEKLGLTAVVLHEQPNSGRTIIEKFEDYSEVTFAVVLLTPDDVGGLGGAPPEGLLPRARQNVILELGYFLGKLGRPRVCALYEDGVDIPSDYAGVLFIPMDSAGAWKLQLAKEMKVVGLPVDMNDVV